MDDDGVCGTEVRYWMDMSASCSLHWKHSLEEGHRDSVVGMTYKARYGMNESIPTCLVICLSDTLSKHNSNS